MSFRFACSCCGAIVNCLDKWVRVAAPRLFAFVEPVQVELTNNPITELYGENGIEFVIDSLPTGPFSLAAGPTAFGPANDNGIGYYNVNSNAVRFFNFLDWPAQTIVRHGDQLSDLLLGQPRDLETTDLTVAFNSLSETPCTISRNQPTEFQDRFISGTVHTTDNAYDSFDYLYQEGTYDRPDGIWQVHGSATRSSEIDTGGDAPWIFDKVPVQPRDSGIVYDTVEAIEVTYTGTHPHLGSRTRRGIWWKKYNSTVGGGAVQLDAFPISAVFAERQFGEPFSPSGDYSGTIIPTHDLTQETNGSPGFYWDSSQNVTTFPTGVHNLSGAIEEVFTGGYIKPSGSYPYNRTASTYLDQVNGIPLVDTDKAGIGSDPDASFAESISRFVGGFWDQSPAIWARPSVLPNVLIDHSQPAVGITSSISFGQYLSVDFEDGVFSASSRPSPLSSPRSIEIVNTYSPLDIRFVSSGQTTQHRQPAVAQFLDEVTSTAIFPPTASDAVGLLPTPVNHPDCDSDYTHCLRLNDTWAVYSHLVNGNASEATRVSDHFDTRAEAIAASEVIHGPFPANDSAANYIDRIVVEFKLDLIAAFPELNFADDEASGYQEFEFAWIDRPAFQFSDTVQPEPALPSPISDFAPFDTSALVEKRQSYPHLGNGLQTSVVRGRHARPTFLGNLAARPVFSYPFSFSNGHNDNPDPRLHQKLNAGSVSVSGVTTNGESRWVSAAQSRGTLRGAAQMTVDLEQEPTSEQVSQSLSALATEGTGSVNAYNTFVLPLSVNQYDQAQFGTQHADAEYEYTPSSIQLTSEAE